MSYPKIFHFIVGNLFCGTRVYGLHSNIAYTHYCSDIFVFKVTALKIYARRIWEIEIIRFDTVIVCAVIVLLSCIDTRAGETKKFIATHLLLSANLHTSTHPTFYAAMNHPPTLVAQTLNKTVDFNIKT